MEWISVKKRNKKNSQSIFAWNHVILETSDNFCNLFPIGDEYRKNSKIMLRKSVLDQTVY